MSLIDSQDLKNYIYENFKIEYILEQIGCHKIKYHPIGNPDPYWSATNPDGDNSTAIIIYNKPSLKCINYTRDMTKGKNVFTDIFTLVGYIKNLSFPQTIKYICDILGLDYYKDTVNNIPESLRITKMLFDMQSNFYEEEDAPIKLINERILKYYKKYVNDMFLNDGISYKTQVEFEIGYDDETNRITIPIRNEIGDLCGIKGRLFKHKLNDNDLKYIYLEPCPRNKILYGLYKTYPFIKQNGCVYVGEAEKFVMQLWDMGFYNSVATSGIKISKQQIEKLYRLGVDIIFAFDKDVELNEIQEIANKFEQGIDIYCIYDKDNILNDKESPSDSKEKWNILIKNNVYKLK